MHIGYGSSRRNAVMGMGDGVLNPVAGTDCGLPFGLFNPSCWQMAATQDEQKGVVSPPPIAPPTAPTGSALVLAPASAAEAQQTINDIATSSVSGSQAQQQTFFQTQAPTATPPGFNWAQFTPLLWGVGIVGGLFLLSNLRRN